MKRLLLICLLFLTTISYSQTYDFSNIKKEECSVFTNIDTTQLGDLLNIDSYEILNHLYPKILINLRNDCKLTLVESNGSINNLTLKYKNNLYTTNTGVLEILFWYYPDKTGVLLIRTRYNTCVIKRNFKR